MNQPPKTCMNGQENGYYSSTLINKCKIIRIGKSEIPLELHKLGGKILEYSEIEKDIGVVIDN